jgi:hypothetical protein
MPSELYPFYVSYSKRSYAYGSPTSSLISNSGRLEGNFA